MTKMLKNHKLIRCLVDHRKIDLVSVDKAHVICTLSPKFTPEDVEPLCNIVGQWPTPQRRNGQNMIIFERFPQPVILPDDRDK